MKILEIVFNLCPGGAERFALDLSNELSKTNDVVLLAIKDDTEDPESSTFYKTEISDRVIYKNIGLKKGFSIQKAWKVYKSIQSEHPDIVHIHGANMPIFCVLAIYMLNRKIKFYQTIHSDIHNGYDTLFYKILFKSVGYRHRMGFVALSETNYRDMMLEYPKTKGACIINGRAPILPSDLFEDVKAEMARYKNNETSKLYLHVARCNPVKNQLLLVEAFGEFVKKGYNADLVIIGGGFESELGQKIRAKSGQHIHIIGTRKNVGDYMLNADVFCLSSDFEGMPITILEASLAGVPIVSTAVCGAVDVVQNGENGVLSEGHTVDDYEKAVEYSYLHDQELKEGAMKTSKDSPYTIDICAKKYLDFFRI